MKRTQIEQLRLCNRCSEVKPSDQFRRRSRSSQLRFRQCNSCHNTAEQDRRKMRSGVDREQRMRCLANRIRATESATQLNAFIQGAVASAGGLEQLLRNWHRVLFDMRASKRWSPRLIPFYEATIRMVTVCAETTRHSIAGQSDDTLLSMVKQTCLKIVKENPRLLLEAANEVGLLVRPPDTDG